jgi:cytochrome c-type biogenesis protein CcmH/NrfG
MAVPELAPADYAEAARQLRAMVEALPPATPRDRRVAHRLTGAAAALDAVATCGNATSTPDPDAPDLHKRPE